jgi:hypothetical protein
MTNGRSEETGTVWRLILVFIGLSLAVSGWMLVVSIFLSFIGLPLFILGLALAQAQER